jgi:predicted transcriptional regulator
MTGQQTDKPTFSRMFSGEVRAELARRRTTATSLAPLLGVSEATIYRRLNGESDWPLDDAMTVAQHLEVSLARLTAGAAA